MRTQSRIAVLLASAAASVGIALGGATAAVAAGPSADGMGFNQVCPDGMGFNCGGGTAGTDGMGFN